MHDKGVNMEKISLAILSITPQDSSPIGNKSALRMIQDIKEFQNLSVDDFMNARDQLIDEGYLKKERGKGGSFKLIKYPDKFKKIEIGVDKSIVKIENDLYKPIMEALARDWLSEEMKYDADSVIIEKTAHKGRKDTGGPWTRPDITIIAVENFPYYPGKQLICHTFEVKNTKYRDIQGVFETAAHSMFAHYSYLLYELKSAEYDSRDYSAFERHAELCKKFGLGLVLFKDPSDWGTYTYLTYPTMQNPEVYKLNEAIDNLLKDDKKKALRRLIS